jgi:hypothetical protein
MALSVGYLVLQMLVAIRLLDLREGTDFLPLTCCPMFAVPRNLFGKEEVRGGVLTDNNLRHGGHVDCAYNFYPWHADLPMTEEDLRKSPGRVLFWLSTTTCPSLLTRLCQSEHLGKDLLVAANFEVSADLKERLEILVQTLQQAPPGAWANATKVREVLDLQKECIELFKADKPAPFVPSLHSSSDMADSGKAEEDVKADKLSPWVPSLRSPLDAADSGKAEELVLDTFVG